MSEKSGAAKGLVLGTTAGGGPAGKSRSARSLARGPYLPPTMGAENSQ